MEVVYSKGRYSLQHHIQFPGGNEHLFQRLIEDVDNVANRAALPMLLKQIAKGYELNSVAYFGLNVSRDDRGEPYLAVTYSAEWVQHYKIENYLSVDPVIRDGFSALLPMEWNAETAEGKKLRKFFGEAGEFGLGRRGLTFPIRGRSGDRALFTITSDVSMAEWRAQRIWLERDLQMLAYHFHQRILAIEGVDVPRVPLAPREIECLKWVLAEKTHWEIAVILGIAEKTVKHYLENARFKLGAATSWHAALKASQQNLLVSSRSGRSKQPGSADGRGLFVLAGSTQEQEW